MKTMPLPDPTGLSMNNIECFLAQVSFLSLKTNLGIRPRFLILNGPFSVKSPNMDDSPGPPFNHRIRGASSGSSY